MFSLYHCSVSHEFIVAHQTIVFKAFQRLKQLYLFTALIKLLEYVSIKLNFYLDLFELR